MADYKFSQEAALEQPDTGMDTSKIRRLENRARQLAEDHKATRQPGQVSWLHDRLKKQEALLKEARQYFTVTLHEQFSLSYAAEWFLDNFSVIQQALRQVKEDMPQAYYSNLPKLISTESTDQPRIHAIALEIIRAGTGTLHPDRVIKFINAYQHITSLTMGELWALPIMLRVILLEHLTLSVCRLTGLQAPRNEDCAPPVALPKGVPDETIVSDAILSLRMVDTQDWKDFFDSVSHVEHSLRRDPAAVYGHMDFDTRDRYRKVVEGLAQGTGKSETDVAQEAVQMGRTQRLQEPHQESQRMHHVGYYLVDAGRAQLEEHLGYRPVWRVRFRRHILDHPTVIYLGSIGLLTLIIMLAFIGYAHYCNGTVLQLILLFLLLVVPCMTIASDFMNMLITRLLPPHVLPKLDFRKGIPANSRTLVVIPTLLTDSGEITSLLEQLEVHFLGNSDKMLSFALLANCTDAAQKHMPGDEALIAQAVAGVNQLNERYRRSSPSPFYFFYRERTWNPKQGVWMAWERKRGLLSEFNRLLLKKGETSFTVTVGDMETLSEIRYVITLDADTVLPRESAHRLIGAFAHPLNRPEFDPQTDTLVAGYTVLQPRAQAKLSSANQSLFAQVFSGGTGLDPYTMAVSDVYQDLFGAGIYMGKGIYDVAAFERSLAGKIPENALLSHDLFEGIHGRTGLVSDVVLFEEYPSGYLGYLNRLHRWIRGDWQLLPWLLPRVPSEGEGKIPNRFSPINRWKIADNLRRSLLAPSLLFLLICSWLVLPGPMLMWMLIALLTPAVSLLMSIITELLYRVRNPSAGLFSLPPSLATHMLRWLLVLVFLPHEAATVLDAIIRTLLRLAVTRRNLLEWTTAAQTARVLLREGKSILAWRRMGVVSFCVLGLALLIGLTHFAAFTGAAPLMLAWFIAPHIAYLISRPSVHDQRLPEARQRYRLFWIARRTWLYFEQFFGPDDHWLPPDHFQESPRGLVAHRTSPTNIGLMLLSTMAAYDLGYIGTTGLAFRLRNTFDTLDKLDRYQGHFLNWYDTRTLNPLPPRYVSAVDSGNLAGCLLALKQGCIGLIQQPVLRWQCFQGLLDTVAVLSEIVSGLSLPEPESALTIQNSLNHIRGQIVAVKDDPRRWMPLLTELQEVELGKLTQHLMALISENRRDLSMTAITSLHIWVNRLSHHLLDVRRELKSLMPWLLPLRHVPKLLDEAKAESAMADTWQQLADELMAAPRLDEAAHLCQSGKQRLDLLRKQVTGSNAPDDQIDAALDWCDKLAESLNTGKQYAQYLTDIYEKLVAQAEVYVSAMEFNALFDSKRQLFHIGYNVDEEQFDNNYYDLLASESRIASLVAIAKGDIPQSHWWHLGRSLTQLDGTRCLLSWSGTMFEYLMPTLITEHHNGTLLTQSNYAAVKQQIAYSLRKHVPWGISESGYYGFDGDMNYQYRAFGVPRLGFKRGLGDELVIAPYASIMALALYPTKVMNNIEHLISMGMLGDFGFYESLDYTPSRLALDQEQAIVRSFMAHHQGMIMMALANFLQDDAIVRRFHADSRVKTVELLLQEQVPSRVPVQEPIEEKPDAHRVDQFQITATPWRVPVRTPHPQVHTLSNGRYTALITNAGSGYSSWNETDLTRWRADTTRDNWGTWIYIKDLDSGDLWSIGSQPRGASTAHPSVYFYPHKADIRTRAHDISSRMEITVSPEDDVEIRHIKLINQSAQPRHLMVASYGEIVLAPHGVDLGHPAFNKLFIQSEYRPELNALLFYRRMRSAEEDPIHMAHLLVVEPGIEVTGEHEIDRLGFLGRGRTPREPSALTQDGIGLSGATRTTLDPIMALGQRIELKPHATAHLAFITLAAQLRQETLALAEYYQEWSSIDRAFDQARSHSEIELRQLELNIRDLERTQQLLSLLLYPSPALRADSLTLASNRRGKPGLWAFTISGDYPILLVKTGKEEDAGLVKDLILAHAYWRNRHIKIDLVILNERDTGYAQEMQDHVHRMLIQTKSDGYLNQRGGIFLIRADQMNQAERMLLATAARVIFYGEKGSLFKQMKGHLAERTRLPIFDPLFPGAEDIEPTPVLSRPPDLTFDNGIGGFSPDGREYRIYLEPKQVTPAPWINVIANPNFGFLVSEAGSGYTWAINSGENRLTPWYNDPVSDSGGEAIYIRDEETGHVWSPTPLPAGIEEPYLIRHGVGYSIFEHNSHGLKQHTTLFAAPNAPVKVVKVRLENTWKRTRRITVTYYAEWVLGNNRDAMHQHVQSEYNEDRYALIARNPYNEEFGKRVAFLSASKKPHGITSDRTEFLGRLGDLKNPAALRRIGLMGRTDPGYDPCAAMQLHIDLHSGKSEEIYFLIGQGENHQEALLLVKQYQDPSQITKAWEEMNALWERTLSKVTVQTPDQAMNLLLNRWLLYQNLSCRIWGRTALYQSSGAFGFRDQLQDVMTLLHAAPDIARNHILVSARHQFEAGDVLHWWHPPSGNGIRTRISDDLLWLPFVTAQYVATTGDQSILTEEIPFLKGDPLQDKEEERYGRYEPTAEAYNLYEHCRRAITKGSTAGPHGLPLIGTGDWNDGMNRVGIEGRGESIWLGWFLCSILRAFAPLCETMGDKQQADSYRSQAHELGQRLEADGWSGGWYLRAYYDDGTPLGSAHNRECQIDAIAQSWAVLSRVGDPARAVRAMDAVKERLVRPNDRLVLLFTPPFNKTLRDPGYIKGYPPGIRENGGQYTHAALWTVWAFAELGQGNLAEQLFRFLNPIYHSDTMDKARRYRVEPYIMAADVYSMPPYTGRGGWTWYTGSGGWMYRLGLEAILGLRKIGTMLRIDPCIPDAWSNYEITYRNGATVYRIRVENPLGVSRGVKEVMLDGEVLPDQGIPLLNDKHEHRVSVRMG
jgi:cyclic beta-1,2-glucan synthetase